MNDTLPHLKRIPDRNAPEPPPQTPGIWLSADEVNGITGLLKKFPYEVAAPIINLLGQKMLALMAEADKK